MKIVYLNDKLGIHDFRFLAKLLQSEYETWLITYHPSKELPDNIRTLSGLKIIHEYAPLTFSAGAEKYPVFIRKALCWLSFTRSFIRLKIRLRKIKPDILHAGWVQGAGFLAALTGFHPFLLMPMGSDVLLVPRMSNRLFLKTAFTIKRADMIISDCEYVKNRIVETFKYKAKKIAVFPRGIDLRTFNNVYDRMLIRKKLGWENNKIMIMPRHFKPVYGIEYFLRALPEVINRVPETRIILCGKGPLERKLKQIVSELGLSEYVHFAGEIRNEELPLYLNAADVYVSVSLSDGTSLSLLEAIACGLPVVVTDVPSNLEWVKDGENGYIVPRQESKILAQKLISLLKDNDMRNIFKQKNLELAKIRADWDKNYLVLENTYREMRRVSHA